MTFGAIVVCGGESRRMGQPKAWLAFGPERMLQRIVRVVGEAARPVVVVAARGQTLPDLPREIRVVHDSLEGRGPLQALEAGLTALGDEVTHVYATATDVPFLVPGWIARLMNLIGDADLAIPVIDGIPHPLASVYRRLTVLPAIRSLLDHDILRLRSLIPLVRTRQVGADELRSVDPDLMTLRNLNTIDDYHASLRQAGFSSSLSHRSNGYPS